MKKLVIIIAAVLCAVVVAVVLFVNFSMPRFDAEEYLALRSRVDSLNLQIFEAGNDVSKKMSIESKRDSLWSALAAMRTPDAPVSAPEAVPAETPAPAPVSGLQNESSPKPTNFGLIIGILAGAIAILALVFFFLRRRQDDITRQMEQIRSEQRFKAPKGGFQDDPTYVTRTRVHRSIIDDAAASAAAERAATTVPKDVQFENENGIPENRIYSGVPGETQTTIRPTARERITSAMQSLSDALTFHPPQGVPRANTIKVRTQSRNTMANTTLANVAQNPMEMTRFDKERDDRERVLQLARRGYTASEIARRTQLPQEQVDTVIHIRHETGK